MGRVTTGGGRVRRTNINGKRNILTVEGKDSDFEYRIVNDTGDRISQFEAQGYEIVADKNVKVGDRRVANPTAEGSPIRISVGGGVQAYLMRIKKEFYEEDKAAKAAYVDRTEQATKADARKSADFGKFEVDKSGMGK